MKKIKLYIAMSLDGYIATENNQVDWLNGDDSDTNNFGTYEKFIEQIDTVILGYNTYNQIQTVLSPDKWPYENMMSYVMTSKTMEDTENIKFVNKKVKDLIKEIKPKKDIWICGGANIIKQFHENDLIDEYTITIIPTILGQGIKLFDSPIKTQKLKLVSTTNYNGIVDLVYEKKDN